MVENRLRLPKTLKQCKANVSLNCFARSVLVGHRSRTVAGDPDEDTSCWVKGGKPRFDKKLGQFRKYELWKAVLTIRLDQNFECRHS